MRSFLVEAMFCDPGTSDDPDSAADCLLVDHPLADEQSRAVRIRASSPIIHTQVYYEPTAFAFFFRRRVPLREHPRDRIGSGFRISLPTAISLRHVVARTGRYPLFLTLIPFVFS